MNVDAVPQAEQLRVLLDPTPILIAHGRHRRRFAEEAAQLDAAALATQSRCHKWTVADVLRHLNDVDSWMDDIWHGRVPPLESFDPNTTPHEFVERSRSVPDAEVRDNFVASCEAKAADVEHSGADRWGAPALSPLGGVPWWLSALHMFFDSWLHERDCLLPLGVDVPVEEDEVLPVLAYILGLVAVFEADELDAVVEGIRVTNGPLPAVVTPVGAPGPLAEVALVADALAGRGDVAAALGRTGGPEARRLGALARRLAPVD